MRWIRFLLAAVGGYALAWLLDPQMGRTRRARLFDMEKARLRRLNAALGRRLRYLGGIVASVPARLTSGRRRRTIYDDATLAQKIRSEVLGPEGYDRSDVIIDVAEGVVELRGPAAFDAHLAARIASVPGVQEVRAA